MLFSFYPHILARAATLFDVGKAFVHGMEAFIAGAGWFTPAGENVKW